MKIKMQHMPSNFQQRKYSTLMDNKIPNKESAKYYWTLCIALVAFALIISITFAIVETYQNSNLQELSLNSVEDYLPSIKFIEHKKIVSCYYNTPDINSMPQLMPSNINPHLCTHINVAFAQVRDKIIYLDDSQWQAVNEIVQLKNLNPNLKILLSVGGAGNSDGFSRMVIDHASRKTFIKSIKYVLRNYSLDGIDLDWEFPGIKDFQSNIFKRERQHFSQLLREIRMEYIREKRNYLLSVAVAAPKVIVDFAYDMEQLNMYVDYVNLMTYDFHYFTEFTPFTGLNSPLYFRPSEELFMATLNVNYTVQMYLSKGMDASKIVLGIPTYGHTFTLVNEKNTNIGSPAAGFGGLGNLGFINYTDICVFMSTNEHNITVKVDDDAKVPYFYRGTEWVSYDNPQSVKEKAEYIKSHNLGGAMIYSLNADDYEGACLHLLGLEKFPLTLSINSGLRDN